MAETSHCQRVISGAGLTTVLRAEADMLQDTDAVDEIICAVEVPGLPELTDIVLEETELGWAYPGGLRSMASTW